MEGVLSMFFFLGTRRYKGGYRRVYLCSSIKNVT